MRKLVNLWLDRPDEVALRQRATEADKSLQEYATEWMRRVAEIEPDHVAVLMGVRRDAYDALRASVATLLADDPDADLDEEVSLHAATCLELRSP